MTIGGTHALAALVFALTLFATFVAAWLGRKHSGSSSHEGLSDEKLNRWLVGLSAGAAANSGFIVTGAVGLGYMGGTRWLLMPLGWLIGDLIYWHFFPARLNAFGRTSQATTLSQLLSHGLSGKTAKLLGMLCAAIVLVCLCGYISAQWLAGQKFLAGAFGVSGVFALILFAILIIVYTSIGGFRGSVYVDSMQAVIRIIGTALAVVVIVWFAQSTPDFSANIAAAGPGFLNPLADLGTVPFLGLVAGTFAGYAAAAIGFGLGQPHLVSRYLAGASPAETQAAKWIFIGFVQFTWLSMTLFGVYLRGIMPGLEDPETGLSAFFEAKVHPVLTGIIIADVFATIAATSNALLVAMSQAVIHDLAPRRRDGKPISLALVCAVMGGVTMAISLLVNDSVTSLALGSISLLGAGLAPAVMAKIMGWRHSSVSLLCAVVAGIATALAWKALGFADALNEALPGILVGMAVNAAVARLAPVSPAASRAQ